MSKLSMFLVALLILGGCTRELDESSSLQIKLPGMSSKIVQMSSGGHVSSKTTSQSAIAWGVASPTLNTQIACYAVLISNPNKPSAVCKDNAGNTVITPSVFAGLYPAGSTLMLDDLPGGASTIHLVGFAATNSSACATVGPAGPDSNSLSEPIIVSEANIDIQSGDNFVDMVVPTNLAGLTTFNRCDTLIKPGNATGAGVSAISIPPAAYGLGSGVSMSVVFSENVNVTGSPRLELDVNGVTRYANYSSGDGTGTLIFDYTVGAADEDLDGLDVVNFIDLNGGTILASASSSALGLGLPTTNFPSVVLDGVAPSSGSISIELGAATVYSTSVNLNLVVTNADEMYITNTAGCTTGGTYEPYSTSKSWILGGTNSTQNVYVKYRDAAGNESPCVSDDVLHQDPANITITETDPYDFGNITMGGSITHSFTLNNIGVATATSVSEISLGTHYGFLGGSFPGTGGTCGGTIAAAAPCTIVVEFAPLASGVLNDTIDISYHNGLATVSSTRDVTGTGVTPANLTISDGPTYDYGSLPVGGTSNKIFTVQNTGASFATGLTEIGLAAPYTFTGGSFPGTGGNCTSSLSPAASCLIDVEYAPVGISASDNDTIDISYNNGASATNATRDITGAAVAPASLSFSGVDPYDFGTAATGSVHTTLITVTNGGGFQASAIADAFALATPFQFTGGSYPGTSGTCISTLNAGANCDVEVEFAPVSTGLANDTLQLDYNDGVNPQSVTVGLQGTGANPALLTISESDPYNFGSINNFTTASHPFTVSNVGGVDATAMTEIGLAAPYQFLGGAYPGTGGTCGATLSPGSCTIIVEFVPTTTGTHNDTISMQYNDGAAVQNANRDVTGTSMSSINFGMLALGKEHSCGVDGSNNIYCWGRGDEGQLGYGGFTSQTSAVAASGLVSVTEINSHFNTTCATDSGNNGYCWGDNTYGEMANGTTGTTEPLPIALPAGATWAKVKVGNGHACGLKLGGNIQCWGKNDQGQTGAGTTGGNTTTPTVVSGGDTYIDLDSNGYHSCGVVNNNTVKCWGKNIYGQLGDGSTTTSNVPVAFSGASGIQSVAVGSNHTCTLDSSSKVLCVGQGNSGQLGDGAGSNSTTPVSPVGNDNYNQITAGNGHTCGLRPDTSVWCWGRNTEGQVGNGTFTNAGSPQQAGTGFVSVTAGYNHTCGIKSNGDLFCWGDNSDSQLGDGTTTNSNVPIYVDP